MIREMLDALSERTRGRFQGFLAHPAEPVDVLIGELDRYGSMLRDMATRVATLDPHLVLSLETTARSLLAEANLGAEGTTLVNAAVRYFLRKEEDYDETTAVLTLDDDVEVFNAVCRSLDRADLLIERRRT